MKPQRSEQEITCIYTRFDIDPPPRELKVSLTGYREIRRASIPLDQVPTPESPTKPGALEVTARVLWWLLF
jgi:hypothetical protein